MADKNLGPTTLYSIYKVPNFSLHSEQYYRRRKLSLLRAKKLYCIIIVPKRPQKPLQKPQRPGSRGSRRTPERRRSRPSPNRGRWGKSVELRFAFGQTLDKPAGARPGPARAPPAPAPRAGPETRALGQRRGNGGKTFLYVAARFFEFIKGVPSVDPGFAGAGRPKHRQTPKNHRSPKRGISL